MRPILGVQGGARSAVPRISDQSVIVGSTRNTCIAKLHPNQLEPSFMYFLQLGADGVNAERLREAAEHADQDTSHAHMQSNRILHGT